VIAEKAVEVSGQVVSVTKLGFGYDVSHPYNSRLNEPGGLVWKGRACPIGFERGRGAPQPGWPGALFGKLGAGGCFHFRGLGWDHFREAG